MTQRLAAAGLTIGLTLGGLAPPALAQFKEGDLYVSSWDDRIYRVDPSTWSVTVFAGPLNPSAVVFSPNRKLLSSLYYLSSISEFDANGAYRGVLDASDGIDGPFGANGLAYDDEANLYVSNYDSHEILRYSAAAEPVVFADAADGIIKPDGLAFAANGNLYVANRDAFNILKINPAGEVSQFDTLPCNVFSIVVRDNGDIYAACSGGDIYRYLGGNPSERVLLASFDGTGNIAMQFDLEHTVLYYTVEDIGNLRTIDPDSGFSTEVIPPGRLPYALSIAVAPLQCEASLQVSGEVFAPGAMLPVRVHIAHHRPKTVTVPWELRLIDASGRVIASHTTAPHTFEPGDVLDRHVEFRLPDDLAGGTYTLELAISGMSGTEGATTTFVVTTPSTSAGGGTPSAEPPPEPGTNLRSVRAQIQQ
jgi:hypothetical protein